MSKWPIRTALLVLPLLIAAAPAPPSNDTQVLTVAGIDAYNNGDIETAFRDLKQAADAEVNLGYMYARGQVVSQDQAAALDLYRRSAAQGNGEGMNAIGFKYATGNGVPADLSTAVQWYCRAIEVGDPRALNNLARLYADGTGVPYDIEEARNLWRQAANLGHVNAMYNLGVSLIANSNDAPTRREGSAWVIRAAQEGMPLAIDLLRANNYTGPLPKPIDTTGMMMLALKGAHGEAKACAVTS